jgi:hypothetical protein
MVSEQDRGEAANGTHVGHGVAEGEVSADLTVEEVAIQAVELQLLPLLLCEGYWGLICTSEAVACGLGE